MPQRSQTIAFPGNDSLKLQAIGYGALEQLNWTIKYAGNNILVGYTPKSWNRYANEITIKSEDNQLSVTSKMIHGESFDLMGRTKKDIASFLTGFDAAKAKATDLNIHEWNEKLSLLKDETVKVAAEESKQAVEVDKVMNLSKGNRVITYGIIGINALVFVLMVASGVSVMAPSGADIINWGGNYAPLTLSGDWWRLISCVFVHIGIIHIAFNMYALYMVGVYLEPMLGKVKYITAYLCTGVFASLASLWWHKDPIASAGASGAIFGMYGVFLALLSTNLIPKQVRNSLLQSILVFVVYNLAYGMKSGVDNAAHIGGLLSGLVIGFLYYPGIKKEAKKSLAILGVLAAATIIAAGFYLQSNKASAEARNKIKDELKEFGYKDGDKYREEWQKFLIAEKKALAPLDEKSLNDLQLSEKLQNISLPEWEKADEAVKKMQGYNVSDKLKRKADLLQQYVDLRKEQIMVLAQFAAKEDEDSKTKFINVSNKIQETLEELSNL